MNDRSLSSRPRVRRAVLALALLGLAMATGIHVAAVLGRDVLAGRDGAFFAMHVAVFPLFAAALLSLRPALAGVPRAEAGKRLAALVPWPWRVAFLLLTWYAAANFFLFMRATGGESAERRGAGYVATSHGRVVRTLTREEHDAIEAWRVRGFSGHWMLFYLVPVMAFGVVRPGADTARAGANPLVRDA